MAGGAAVVLFLATLIACGACSFPRLFVTTTMGSDMFVYEFRGSSFPSDPVQQLNPKMQPRGWGQHPNSMIYMYECRNDTTAYNSCNMQKMDRYYTDMITYQADERCPPTPRYATCWNPFVFGFRMVENRQQGEGNMCEQPTITLTGDKGLSLPRFECSNDAVIHYCVAGGQRGETCVGYSTPGVLLERCYANSGKLGMTANSRIEEPLGTFIRTDKNRQGNHSYFAVDTSSGSAQLLRYAHADMERRELVNVGRGEVFVRMGYYYERSTDYVMWLLFDSDLYTTTVWVFNTLTWETTRSVPLKGKPTEFVVGGEYVLQ